MPVACLVAPDPARPAIPIHAVEPDGLAAALAGLTPAARAFAEANAFKAGAGAVVPLPGPDGALAAVLFGLGKPGAPSATPLAAGRLATALPAGTYRLASGFADPATAALAFGLGAYRFTRYRASSDGDGPKLVIPDGVDAADLLRTAESVYFARDLVNTPAIDLGPADLAAAARGVAEGHGASYRETVGEALLAENFPMVFAVGMAAAADRAPRLVDISWGDPAAPKVTVVGKGVCFDTGGLDIKPSSNMILMKKDMGGAANALALAQMIMGAGLKVRLRVLIPAVENAISGPAFRPGDILKSRKGLTVEIGNTDAEGRLILADALTLASEEKPDLLVDLATLTGAARTALGPEIPPFFTDDESLAADLSRHAALTADPLWRLPLWRPYLALMDSRVADINNAGSSPYAGSITAALFLSRFVGEGVRWAHFDIFAWNPSAKPGRPEGGEAQAIRALFALIRERYA